ncbi:hypothetical protein BC937DRAFT_87261 [Endogone sp. FLAS-F59071]|nr:hypothetical protein BC937DRAFT_87261 [Endogone sp. FLAS-F59071]|eukprot:RUS19570.1 hypothetical protein BC937DRAFT_87261 [Endogone sp. FLAS-F59071]
MSKSRTPSPKPNEENVGESIAPENKGAFVSFIKSLASFTGDLSNLTCPSFLLSPISLLEYSSYWGDHPELFVAISEPDDPEARMIACLKWFISSLSGSFASRVSKQKGEYEKKPYNPVLGERFFCTWDSPKIGKTNLVCEQVSHHPPISAFYLENSQSGVVCNGHNGQKSRFSATTIYVDQIGHGIVHLLNRQDETYLFTLPSLAVNGLWYGAPSPELQGSTYIQSSSGYTASIEYSTRGWVSGELHHFKATITNGNPDNVVTIEGQWTGASSIYRHHKSPQPFFDISAIPTPQKIVAPVSKQHELESRKLWKKVTDALIAKDYSVASSEKSKIENKQRAERKERKENDSTWEPAFFKWVDPDPVYEALDEQIEKKTKDKHADLGKASWISIDFLEKYENKYGKK